MSNQLSHVTSAIMREPWLIEPVWLDIIAGILDSHLAGKEIPKVEKKKADGAYTQSGVDFIPVNGPIAPKMGLLENISGGTSVSALRDELAAALSNPDHHGPGLARR